MLQSLGSGAVDDPAVLHVADGNAAEPPEQAIHDVPGAVLDDGYGLAERAEEQEDLVAEDAAPDEEEINNNDEPAGAWFRHVPCGRLHKN